MWTAALSLDYVNKVISLPCLYSTVVRYICFYIIGGTNISCAVVKVANWKICEKFD